MKRFIGHKMVYLAVALLWACSGGAGPGAALDGGSAGGGPVGGNFAAGPVSLPAPSVVSPNNPVEWVNISCTNVAGPNFECRGTVHSVPANTEIQLSIYAPAAAVPRDSFSVQAGADGAWLASREGAAGESVEICPKIGGVCQGTRLFKLPPTGATVEGPQGTMKNLVIDPTGTSWHSRWLPRGLSWGRLFASLWISEASAQEAANPYTPVACDASYLGIEPVPPADAPGCRLYRAVRGDAASTPMVTFENCEQTDIHAIVSTQIPLTGRPLLLVAVKNRVYLIDIMKVPTISWTYSFPNEVTSLLDQGGGRFIVAAKPSSAVPGANPGQFFYLDVGRKGSLAAGCYASNDTLRGLEGVTSSDSLNDAFAMVAYKPTGQYQVFLGRTQPGSVLFRNQPMPLGAPSANPLEVRLLKVEDEYVYLAILNGAEKKITLIKHYQPTTDVLVLDAPADLVKEIGLEGLTADGAPLSVSRPQLFNVNRESRELVYVDISEQGTRLVSVPYAVVRGEWAPVTTASALALGNAGPAFLMRDNAEGAEGGWAYNDGPMQIIRVRSQREQLQMQLRDNRALQQILRTEEVLRLRAPAGDDGAGSEE
ncbi:MAG: hypothetical protein U1F66_09885 [bacterium]